MSQGSQAGKNRASAEARASSSNRSSVSVSAHSSSTGGGKASASASTTGADGRTITKTHDKDGCTIIIDERAAKGARR